MPQYRVKAIRPRQGAIELSIEADSPVEAGALAEKSGYAVLAVRAPWSRIVLSPTSSSRIAVVEFAEELIALLEAGLTVVDSIDALSRRSANTVQRSALNRVSEQLRTGARFATALDSCGSVFPPLFVAAIRASEGTGTLTDALARYVSYETQLEQARNRIASASVYPALLLVAGGFVMLFLLAYVVPRFSRLYREVSAELPWGSRVLMDFGQLIDGHAPFIVGGFLALVACGTVAIRRRGARAALMQLFSLAPGIRPRARLFELSRLYRTLGLLLRSGISILPALSLAKASLSPTLAARIDRATESIRGGRPLSHAFDSEELTTEVATRMLSVAERTGALSDMLERAAAFHERELTRWLERATRLFEPILMAIIGLIIGVVVVLMYMPIFDLAGSLG